MVILSNKSDEMLWETVNKIRLDFLKASMTEEIKCMQKYYNTVSIKYKTEQLLQILEKEFHLSFDQYKIFSNVDNSDLELGFKIYFFLHFCPKYVMESPWTKYFYALFDSGSTKNILGELVRLIKVSKNKRDMDVLNMAKELLKAFKRKVPVHYENSQNTLIHSKI